MSFEEKNLGAVEADCSTDGRFAVIDPQIADMLLEGGRYYSLRVVLRAVKMPGAFQVMESGMAIDGQAGDYLVKMPDGSLNVYTGKEVVEQMRPARRPRD